MKKLLTSALVAAGIASVAASYVLAQTMGPGGVMGSGGPGSLSSTGQVQEPGALGAAIGSFGASIIYGRLWDSACTRHFYNNSNDWWEVIASEEVKSRGLCSRQGECIFPPHQTKEIHYPNISGANGFGTIRLLSRGGQVYDQTFRIDFRNNCVYIWHDGNTGKGVLNDPANGDIVGYD